MEASLRREVQVVSDTEALGHAAASLFINFSKNAIEARGRFLVAISGGSTPDTMFSLLGSDYSRKAEWKRIVFFWVDERCVPEEHKDSNFRSAHERLFSRIPLPENNIHRIRGEFDPADEAKRYEDEIKKAFGTVDSPSFDLVILGMGADGHTASLFPGSPSLEEKERFVIPVYAEHLKSWRITLTLPVLNNSGQIVFLVSGEAKASVLADILENKERQKLYPAGLVNPEKGSVIWLVDEAAARNLRFR